ncbi:hypothetical protein DMB83_011765 [Pectobacterium aquaticum]|nr:hypothetical protein DMB83_011765 [Pectobacterium aquaticum]
MCDIWFPGACKFYTRHTSSCLCVGCPYSPQSLTCVSSWGFARLPHYKAINEPCPNGPTHSVVQNANVLSLNSNYLGILSCFMRLNRHRYWLVNNIE